MKILLSFFLFSMVLSFNVCNQTVDKTPCFTDRSVTGKLEGKEVKCSIFGEQFILLNEKENTRYVVCNSGEFELIGSNIYIISGSTYEIKANERWPGTPLQLASAKKKE